MTTAFSVQCRLSALRACVIKPGMAAARVAPSSRRCRRRTSVARPPDGSVELPDRLRWHGCDKRVLSKLADDAHAAGLHKYWLLKQIRHPRQSAPQQLETYESGRRVDVHTYVCQSARLLVNLQIIDMSGAVHVSLEHHCLTALP